MSTEGAAPSPFHSAFPDPGEDFAPAQTGLPLLPEQVELALEAARIGAWDFNLLTGLVHWDPRCRDLFGVPGRDVLDYDRILRCIHAEDRPEVDRAVKQATSPESDGHYNIEYRVMHPDGSLRWIQARGRTRFEGEGRERRAVRFSGVILDITPQRRTLEALRETDEALRLSEARYRRLADSNIIALGIFDTRGGIREVNDYYLDMLGYTREDLAAGLVRWDRITPPEFREADEKALRELAEKGVCTPYEKQYLRKDGGRTWVQLFLSRAPVSEGSEELILGLLLDITERKQSDERLNQARKMESIGRLAGGIAHDFNNLLTAINGYAELLIAGLAADPERLEFAREIRNAGARAATLTQQLLAYSRRQLVQNRTLSLDDAVRGMESVCRRLLGPSIALETRAEPDPWPVKMDPGQLEQVILNLTLNARDAMPAGGLLSFTTRKAEWKNASPHPDDLEPGRYMLLEVKDTGVGMTEAVKGRIFEPFFTTKAPGQGTGLGLATVYGIVKQAGGSIAVDSEPGKGAVFRLLFPAAPEPRSTPQAP